MTTSTGQPQPRLSKATWIVMGVTAAVFLAAVGVAVAVGVTSGSGSSASTVQVANLVERPTVGNWSIENAFASQVENGGSGVSASLGSIEETAVDQALVSWTYSTGEESVDEQQLALVDTRSGKTLWIRDWTGPATIVSSFGGPGIVVQGSQGLLTTIDRATGETISESETETNVIEFGLSTGFAVPLDRILLATAGGVNLYATSDLTAPLWEEGIPLSSNISGFSSDRFFTSEASYSTASGEELPWDGALGSDITYLPGGALWPSSGSSPELVRFEATSNGGTLASVSPSDGSSLWEIELNVGSNGYAFDRDGVLALDGHTLTKFGGTDGKKVWSQDGYSGVMSFGPQLNNGFAQSPVDFVQSAETSGLVALDPLTGEELYSVTGTGDSTSGASDSQSAVPLGASADVLYLTTSSGPKGSELFAYDLRTGLEQWRIGEVYNNWYSFRIVGGNLVAVLNGLSFSSDDADDFSDHPALLGIG